MKLKTNSDILGFSMLATAFACAVVVPVIMLLYPREEWLWELSLSLLLTISITMSLMIFIGKKIVHINELSDELQRLVARDRLTDVATRDHFYAVMADAPDAYGVSLMVDIDHFKAVNDTHGHIAGDAVIRRVARVLQSSVGPQDMVCRFGGEEFVIFLHESSVEAAATVAEIIRQAVAAEVVTFEGKPLTVTVSIGGSLQARCADIDAAIRDADAALYLAKAQGRNGVVFHRDQQGSGEAWKAAG